MSELARAAERLTQAVDRLEAAVTRRRAAAPPDDDRLAQELARARADLLQFETVTDGVSHRLDGAIRRLEAALG